MRIYLKLEKALTSLEKDFSTLRTGRASPNILDNVLVESHGTMVKLNLVSTISVPEPRTITISVWDKQMVKIVDDAIRKSNLGINPLVDGNKIKLSLPALTEETRKDLVKKASEYSEKCKIVIRQIRKNFMDDLKKIEKDKLISEDEFKRESEKFDETIKIFNGKVETLLDKKSKETMQL